MSAYIMKLAEDLSSGLIGYGIFDHDGNKVEEFKGTPDEAKARAANDNLTPISYARLLQIRDDRA